MTERPETRARRLFNKTPTGKLLEKFTVALVRAAVPTDDPLANRRHHQAAHDAEHALISHLKTLQVAAGEVTA